MRVERGNFWTGSSKNCLVHFIKCYKLLWRNNSYIFLEKIIHLIFLMIGNAICT